MKKDGEQQRQTIYESINEFFARVFQTKNSKEFKKFLHFIGRNPSNISFNSGLVYIQKPDCGYYLTATQWESRYHRTVKADARPLIVLFPFGPVSIVYDYADTEGEAITEEEMLYWWREHGGQLDGHIISNTLKNLEQLDITGKTLSARDYFRKGSLRTAGYVWRDDLPEREMIALHPRYQKTDLEAYGVLCHEIAHVLLGHLGSKIIWKKRKGERVAKTIAKDARYLPTNVQEVEAELVAWIVFNSLGRAKRSEEYIAM